MLIEIDHSGLEWRTYIQLSGDDVGLQEILAKEDIHRNNQTDFKLPERRIAKFFLFRAIYRGTAWSYAHDPDFTHVSTSERYWQRILDKFFEKYDDLWDCHERYIKEVEDSGGFLVVKETGRTYQFEPKFDKFDGGYKWPISKITNYPNQGIGNTIVAITRLRIRERLKPFGPKVLLCNTVHDSIVIDTPPELGYNICIECEKACEETPEYFTRQFGHKWIVPLAGECKYGPNWKDMKPFRNKEGKIIYAT